MERFSRSRMAGAWLAFTGAVCSAVFGVSLIMKSGAGFGSRSLDILIGGIGLLMILASPLLIIFGIIEWKRSKSAGIN